MAALQLSSRFCSMSVRLNSTVSLACSPIELTDAYQVVREVPVERVVVKSEPAKVLNDRQSYGLISGLPVHFFVFFLAISNSMSYNE
jgi:hypothetical protein